jgi:hypothetical protein
VSVLQSKRRMKELADEYHRLLHRKTARCKEDTECQVSRESRQLHDKELHMGGGILWEVGNVYKFLI